MIIGQSPKSCRVSMRGNIKSGQVMEMILMIVVGVVGVVSGFRPAEFNWMYHAIVHEPRTHHGISIVRKVNVVDVYVPERRLKECRAALTRGWGW